MKKEHIPISYKELYNQAARLNKGDLFIPYLLKSGYKEVLPNNFTKDDPKQEIELSKVKGQIHFSNKLMKEDQGTFIQFLQNRLIDSTVVPDHRQVAFMGAILIAVFEEPKLRPHATDLRVVKKAGKQKKLDVDKDVSKKRK
ncbi:hypothetical protein PV783_14020 [Chitinophaga sp. CC14]|uniref:hypothetical protein n=1 Tax=Chitinophaga sp. CC14 TaxID=3029199 RepID=UPI003B7B850D